jgi:hypothetical protein
MRAGLYRSLRDTFPIGLSMDYLTPDELVQQLNELEQARQGDPDRVRFVPAFPRLPRSPGVSIQEGETTKKS